MKKLGAVLISYLLFLQIGQAALADFSLSHEDNPNCNQTRQTGSPKCLCCVLKQSDHTAAANTLKNDFQTQMLPQKFFLYEKISRSNRTISLSNNKIIDRDRLLTAVRLE